MKRLLALFSFFIFLGACTTGLHKAVGYQDYSQVQRLVENGADINSTDRYENTPLILSSYYGSLPIVKYLCENGAEVNR